MIRKRVRSAKARKNSSRSNTSFPLFIATPSYHTIFVLTYIDCGTKLQTHSLRRIYYRCEVADMSTQEIKALKAHLALNVRNIDESIAFYRKMLGIEPSKVRTGYAKFDVQNPPLNLTLNQGVFD